MRNTILSLSLSLNLSLLNAADITVKSAGTGADGSGISFQNSEATELMVIEGDGDASIDGTTLHIDAGNNKIGMGTASPTTQLHVTGTEGLLVQGSYNSGTALNLGEGTRMHFYPRKAAFRVGRVEYDEIGEVGGDEWNDGNIGAYSVAMGYGTSASGFASTAMGNATASGDGSTAMGYATASGGQSTAMGAGTASGWQSTAMGGAYNASGQASTAMGNCTTASGHFSTVM